MTVESAARALLQAREDVAALMTRRYEDIREGYRLLDITGELYEGITGEEAPEVEVRASMERAS